MVTSEDGLRTRISDNLNRVLQRMVEAAQRAGRSVDAIRLLGVTKYASLEETQALYAAGCHDLAESRPQDLWDKAKQLIEPDLRWHFIGHLQRNKVRRTLPWLNLLHSLDSQRLLEELESEASRAGLRVKILLEVNISGDSNKTGIAPNEVESLVEKVLGTAHVELCGLMGMAGLGTDSLSARRCFDQLRELRDDLQVKYPAANLSELSMGMSGDFESAIAAGSTMVRIGSALFE